MGKSEELKSKEIEIEFEKEKTYLCQSIILHKRTSINFTGTIRWILTNKYSHVKITKIKI